MCIVNGRIVLCMHNFVLDNAGESFRTVLLSIVAFCLWSVLFFVINIIIIVIHFII